MSSTPFTCERLTADWKNNPQDEKVVLDGCIAGCNNTAALRAWMEENRRGFNREYTDSQLLNKLNDVKKWGPVRKAALTVKLGKLAKKTVVQSQKWQQALLNDARLRNGPLGSANVSFAQDDDDEYVPDFVDYQPPRIRIPVPVPHEPAYAAPPAEKKIAPPLPRLIQGSKLGLLTWHWEGRTARTYLIFCGLPQAALVHVLYDPDNQASNSVEVVIEYNPKLDLHAASATLDFDSETSVQHILIQYPPMVSQSDAPTPVGRSSGVCIFRFNNKGVHNVPMSTKFKVTS